MSATPYQFIKQGNLFIVPVGSSIAEVPYPTQSFTKPPDYSLWVHGKIQEPGLCLDRARMAPRLYQEVRDDVTRFSPVEVTRSAFQRSQYAYVGVIDSRGTPYYFALDSRGVSVREVDVNDDRVWKTFERLAEDEHMAGVRERRSDSADEMRMVDRELSTPALVVTKALPRKSKEDSVKKTPSRKASKKQAGAGGKTRYTYPQERNKKPQAPGPAVPLVVVHDDTKHADPAELANQLGVSVRTLQRCAKRLGSDGFGKFMRAHLKRFAAKHRLDPDYWNTLYATLLVPDDSSIAKSDDGDASKQFGHHVKQAAASTQEGHPERFGDRKVFIHHVHHEMKRNGTYDGNLNDFKHKLVQAHQKGHVVLSRADYVAGMNQHSVDQSETEAKHGGKTSATFHFVNHEPEASKKLTASGHPHDAAHAASAAAISASAHARRVGTSEAHLAAMSAHHQAGVAHQKATGKVSNKTSLRHFDQSTAHLSAAKTKA